MAYIYKITNKINQKSYIGKTYRTVNQRFKEHCKCAEEDNLKNRPLYAAMRKYGIINFQVEQLEETNNPEEREKYWIEYFHTFKEGYNATTGGDGKPYFDYELIYQLFQKGYTIVEICDKVKCNYKTCKKALDQYHISSDAIKLRKVSSAFKKVAQLEKNTNNIIQIFNSIVEACSAIGEPIEHGTHISRACREKRRSAYGYSWKYI